jgi:hypothetical protein
LIKSDFKYSIDHEWPVMLPPVDDAVLRDNPQFAAMYKQLTTVYLNPDGSTKNDAVAKERQRVREVREATTMIF